MKKQGPPPTFEETQASRKRKAIESTAPGIDTNKKRRAVKSGPAPLLRLKQTNGFNKSKAFRQDKSRQSPPSLVSSSGEDRSEDSSVDGASSSHLSDTLDGIRQYDLNELESDDLEDVSDFDDEVFDSDEGRNPKAQFSEDEDASEAEEQLTAANIEGLSRKLDQEQAVADAQAQQELEEAALQTNIHEDSTGLFDKANQQQPGLAPDLQLLRTRITDTIRILGDFSKLADPGKHRSDYTSLLLDDISTYYGYTPYLAEKLFSLFTPTEAFAFFEANESPRPVVLRTNTLRTNRRTLAQALINRGVVLEPVGKWSKVGLQVFESAAPIGATPQYLSGHYMLQAASSFLPVIALAPQPNERILDMAAAPGGKTTYISALMRNTGCIFANDSNRQRAKGLIGNIHRLGCKNTVVTNLDAKEAFPKVLGGFDRVLLDAPCSGTGVIGKDPSVKTSKTERDFLALPHMQKQLLLAAIDSTDHASKTGGCIVYSTCSVTVEENEGVVQYALSKRPNVKIVDTGLDTFGSEGFRKYKNKRFDDKMTLTRRYFPHRENVDGFFVCKLRKTGPSPKTPTTTSAGRAKNATSSTLNRSHDRAVNGGMDTENLDTVATRNGDGNDADVSPIDTDMDSRANPSVTTAATATPPINPSPLPAANDDDEFGGFDAEEDEAYIARAERKWLRRRGVDPRVARTRKGKSKGSRDGGGGGGGGGRGGE